MIEVQSDDPDAILFDRIGVDSSGSRNAIEYAFIGSLDLNVHSRYSLFYTAPMLTTVVQTTHAVQQCPHND